MKKIIVIAALFASCKMPEQKKYIYSIEWSEGKYTDHERTNAYTIDSNKCIHFRTEWGNRKMMVCGSYTITEF